MLVMSITILNVLNYSLKVVINYILTTYLTFTFTFTFFFSHGN